MVLAVRFYRSLESNMSLCSVVDLHRESIWSLAAGRKQIRSTKPFGRTDLKDFRILSPLHNYVRLSIYLFLGRNLCTQYIRCGYTDGVARSVCLLATFSGSAKTAKPIEMSFGRLTRVGPRCGSRSPHGKGQFWGLSGPSKNIGNHCCGALRSKKINNGDNGTAAAGCNAPDWSMSYCIAPAWKTRLTCDVA